MQGSLSEIFFRKYRALLNLGLFCRLPNRLGDQHSNSRRVHRISIHRNTGLFCGNIEIYGGNMGFYADYRIAWAINIATEDEYTECPYTTTVPKYGVACLCICTWVYMHIKIHVNIYVYVNTYVYLYYAWQGQKSTQNACIYM